MCGIAGWINYKESIMDNIQVIEKMINRLQYRGPDECGKYLSNTAILGHKRLVVVDPEGGKQPMLDRMGGITYSMVYNGELYNTEDIRKKLSEEGCTFNSYSDTEVLLKSYMHWGEKCLDYLNGIYAFAIWEDENKTLFLARDRLGVKPLFYTEMKDEFIFGSEIKALLEHPKINPIIEEEGLLELFGLGPARTLGSGVFKNIHEVKPGEFIKITPSKTVKKMYWELKAKEHTDNFADTTEQVRFLLSDAIERQLVADVPVCTFLSGGLDSSIISAISSKAMQQKGYLLKTFSIDYFDNHRYFTANEFQPDLDNYWISLMVDAIKSEHHNVVLTIEDLIDALDQAVLANDLPGMADIDSSLYLFCKKVRKHATVGLSGECADEIFGGYPWFNKPEDLVCDTFPWSQYVNRRKSILAKKYQKIPLDEYVKTVFDSSIAEGEYCDDPELAKIQKMTYLNIKWFMMTLLNRKDRMSMANSLEVRVPFADHRIVEYTYNIPWEMKRYGNLEKGLVREAMRGILPEEVLERKKNPYPKTHHPKYLKLIQKKMKKIIKSKDAPILEVMEYEALKNIVDTGGKAFDVPWYGQLMTGPQLLAYFYQINYWLEKYEVDIH
ncbi:asparagine synthase (glutamine-hydrolyzing) [Vallitalea okinawensis]|uniref:asparagine synthase (glutamine-hydrolyzing) n=1 Tax=Vallitalea okinawensis TaxID=2078660 RepID=UPI000CFB13EC|nr:asparagine synthase (glutamine-hydrolyzing) [Vallitalea okinawensis]